MAGGVVEYIIGLRDQFSAAAAKVAEAAALAEKRARAMGAAANQAEAALNRIKPPAGAAAAAKQFDAVAAAAQRAATAAAASGAAGRMNARDWASTYGVWRAENKALDRELAQTQRRAQEHASWWQRNKGTFMGGAAQGAAHSALGWRGSSMLEKGMGAWMGWTLGSMAVHGVDKAITRAADVDTMRKKLAFVLGDQGMADAAVNKAFDLSGIYKNTKVAENLEIIDDLRANLPEKFPKILEEATEPFVKLYSFWKAWDGGKHKDVAKSALKDVGLAIRSGELSGKVTHDELQTHARNLSIAKAVFGEKFKMSEYFAAQKRAGTAFPAMSEEFKNIGFNVLVQRMGVSGGVSTATLFSKLVQGIRMRSYSLEQFRQLGLVNEDLIRSGAIKINKQGKIDVGSVAGQQWLADTENLAATNPLELMIKRMFPRLQKSGKVRGLDSKGILEAYNSGNVEQMAELIKKIDKVDLSRVLGPLGQDRTAVMALFENAMMAANVLRDTRTWATVEASMKKANDQFLDYFAAKTMAADQADRFWQALTGKDFVPWATRNIKAVGDALGWLGTQTKDSDNLRGAIKWGAITAGGAVALAVAARLAKAMGGLGKLGRISVALSGVELVLSQLDAIKAGFKNVAELAKTMFDGKKGTTPAAGNAMFDKMQRWLGVDMGLGDLINAATGGALYRAANQQRFAAAGAPWKHGMDVLRDVQARRAVAQDDERHRRAAADHLDAIRARRAGGSGGGYIGGLSAAAGNLAKSQAEVTVQTKVHTTFDTVKVVPERLQIQITGPGTGPSSVGMSGGEAHPRGTSMSEPASTKVAR